MPKRESKKAKPLFPSLPPKLKEFYIALTEKNYSHDKVMGIVMHEEFTLTNQDGVELQFHEDQMKKFHDHDFETPLLAICHMASQHYLEVRDEQLAEVMMLLLHKGATVQARTLEGMTPLLLVAECTIHREPLTSSAIVLIQAGANINDVNEEGKSALHFANAYFNFKLVKILTANDIRIVQDNDGLSFIAEICSGMLDTDRLKDPILQQEFMQELSDYKLIEAEGPLSADYISSVIMSGDAVLMDELISLLDEKLIKKLAMENVPLHSPRLFTNPPQALAEPADKDADPTAQKRKRFSSS